MLFERKSTTKFTCCRDGNSVFVVVCALDGDGDGGECAGAGAFDANVAGAGRLCSHGRLDLSCQSSRWRRYDALPAPVLSEAAWLSAVEVAVAAVGKTAHFAAAAAAPGRHFRTARERSRPRKNGDTQLADEPEQGSGAISASV